MISKSISVSKQVNGLSRDAKLLFTWLIPHCDDFGRMTGDPDVIKAIVFPMDTDFTPGLIESCLTDIENMRLIIRYNVDGEQFLCFPKWEVHQGNLTRRTASKFPDPPENLADCNEIHGDSVNFIANITKPNITKPNITKESADSHKPLPEGASTFGDPAVVFFQEHIKAHPSQAEVTGIIACKKKYGLEFTKGLIEDGEFNGAQTWRFIIDYRLPKYLEAHKPPEPRKPSGGMAIAEANMELERQHLARREAKRLEQQKECTAE